MRLGEEYAGQLVALAAYLAGLWCEAMIDLENVEIASELYERFLAWPRQR